MNNCHRFEHANFEVIEMDAQNNKQLNTEERASNKGMSADVAKSKPENQNQNHNTRKVALGPNTKR